MIKELHRSTPFRIAVIYASLFSLSLIALLSVIYHNAVQEFEDGLRKRVTEEAEKLAAGYRNNGFAYLRDKVESRTHDSRLHGLYFELRDGNNRRSSGNLPTAIFKPGWDTSHIYEDPDDVQENNLTTVMALGVELGKDARLIVGGNHERLDDMKDIMLRPASWILGLTALLALGGALLINRAAMRRIAIVSSTSRSIMDGNLSLRLPLSGTGDELDGLSTSINEMLERIEVLMATMKKVTSDIAHDLRTPLGRLRQQLELARDNETTPEGYRTAFDHAIAQTDEIVETFNALLRIGQIDSGSVKARFAEIDISAFVERIVETYTPVAEDLGQHIAPVIQPNLRIVGDRELFAQMLANLIENAINHCPAATKIGVDLQAASGILTLTISDNGPGIPSDEREKVLRPFYRLEKSRTSDGSGLGLALVDAIARIHGFDLTLSDNEPGLKVELRMAARTIGAPASATGGTARTT